MADPEGDKKTILDADLSIIDIANGVQGVDQSQEVEPKSAGEDVIEAERQSRKADMGKLRMMDAEARREIAQLDMMGEYGSKVRDQTFSKLTADQLPYQAFAVVQDHGAAE